MDKLEVMVANLTKQNQHDQCLRQKAFGKVYNLLREPQRKSKAEKRV